ncbi:hypothetical protein C2S51_033464 [Perilla frutescens var. frutescens]|nr:hypothetical protein C2S51_033464 [Perilla frutescens var. frutescens]
MICISLLSAAEICGLGLRRRGGRAELMVEDRMLKAAADDQVMSTMEAAAKKPAAPFDSNQSSKRKVPKGSDPIHNRT